MVTADPSAFYNRKPQLPSGHTNALAESFFSSLKTECLNTRPWPTHAAARGAIVDYIAWYNGTRLHSTLGYTTPNDYEQAAKKQATTQVA